jgi:translation initiation factor IF-2
MEVVSMAKVRIHVLAKELEIQSKDVIKYLTEKNIEVKSASSSIDEEVAHAVRAKYAKEKTSPKEEIIVPKDEKQEIKTEDRPKKKSSITAVFHPQNSKMGIKRQGQRDKKQTQRQDGMKAAAPKPEKAEEIKPSETPKVDPAKSDSIKATSIKPEPTESAKAEPVRSEATKQSPVGAAEQNKAVNAKPEAANGRSDVNRPANNRSEGGRTGAPRQDGNRPPYQRQDGNRQYNQRQDGNRQSNQRQDGNRPSYQRQDGNRQGTPRQDGNRPPYQRTDGNRPPYQRDGNRGGAPRQDSGRPDQSRPDYKRNDRPVAGTGQRPPYRNNNNSERGPRNDNEKGNKKNFTNSRPGGNRGQIDKGNQRVNNNRTKEPRNRLEQEITKLNQNTATVAEETRGKEGRENRRGVNNTQKLDKKRDFGNKKQERFNHLEKGSAKKKRPQSAAPAPREKEEEVIKTIILPDSITIKELADKMKIQVSAIVKKLLLQGIIVTVNQDILFEQAEEIALEYNFICEREIKIDVIEELLREEEEDESKMVKRAPVVCVMGHVDHGKTSLLDAIRDTNVIDREAGGITQHIGAYTVTCNGEKIAFLDTPGHEAFTAMRMRGANATDIAILVVAADDGVMPQTIEAISHAKAAGVEIIVAINKIDKPSANIERVKQELSEYELIPEDWGGSTIFVPVSAHTREGIDNLLEMILLTAEVAELKANAKRLARGLVIEAQLDKGRGVVATILVQKGTLKIGQPVAAGSCYGKVRAMIDDKGRRVKEAGPSTPVEILGLHNVPNAGEIFVSTNLEKDAKSFADTFISQGKEKLLEDTKSKMSLDDLFTQIKSGNVKELGIIVKADVQGSVEAVKQSLLKLSNEEVVVKIVHGGVGAINESDVSLASTSNAIIIGFNVRPDAQAKITSDREGVDLRLYKVIYNAIEDVQAAMKGMLDPIFEEKILGHAEVRQIFKASGIGNIAGSYILDGLFQRGCKVRITREGKQIFEGSLASLKRFKDDVKEVKTGYECGLVFDGFHDIQEMDVVEAYTMVEVPR